MNAKPFRMGVVGLGMAAKPHAPALADLRDTVEVAGAFSPSPERRAAFAAGTGFPVVSSLEALLEDPSVDALLVLTPPLTHLELVKRCAAAGKRVLLEKPLEPRLSDAVALVETMEEADLRLGVVFQHRFRLAVRRLRAALEEGMIGEPTAASVDVRWWRPPSYYAEKGRGTKSRDGGGVLITQAIHSLDVYCSLAGPIAEVACFTATSPTRTIDTEDTAAGSARFVNGAIGTIGATTAAHPGFPERIELTGTRGTATLVGNDLRVSCHGGREVVVNESGATGGGSDPMAFDRGPHRDLIADFVAATREDRPCATNGRSALVVHRLIDALLRSAEERRFVAVS